MTDLCFQNPSPHRKQLNWKARRITGIRNPDSASLHIRKKEVVLIEQVQAVFPEIKNSYTGEKIMKFKQFGTLIGLLVAVSLVLAACAPATAPVTDEPAMQEEPQTSAPAA